MGGISGPPCLSESLSLARASALIVETRLLARIWAPWACALPHRVLAPLCSGIFRNCLCQGSRGWLLNSATPRKEETVTEILGIVKTSKGTRFKHLDGVLENWGSARLSHFTQESLFVSKARLSVCLELTHKTVPRVPLHGRRQGDLQATCALEFAGGPSSSLAHRSSHCGSAELMSGNLLCHSTCTAGPEHHIRP